MQLGVSTIALRDEPLEHDLIERMGAAGAASVELTDYHPSFDYTDLDAFSVLRRSWTVPILAVTGVPSRFSAIKADLGPVTDRALSKSLGVLEDQEWLRRDIDLSQRTPFPIYHAVNAGLKINQAIAAGAR